MLNKISLKLTGIIIASLNAFTLFIQILVMLRVLPYNIIGGGRIQSYQAACSSVVQSIIIIGFGTVIVLIASGIIKFNRFKVFIKVWLWLSFACMCLNIIFNLLGKTLFEKIVMGLVTVIQAILLFRLVTAKPEK